MQYRTLGRSGIKVSLLGLGTGGARRLGQIEGLTQTQQNAFIRQALDTGVNFFDTSEGYGQSEGILGEALKGVPRDSYVIATKWQHDGKDGKDPQLSRGAQGMAEALENSLKRLRTDHVEVLMFHGIHSTQYDIISERLLPTMVKLKEQGKIRLTGFSTRFPQDPGQVAALKALKQHPLLWDVIELKYGILNQIAADEALPLAVKHGVGIVNMAAVRVKLPSPTELERLIAEWKQKGYIAPNSIPDKDPLGWLVKGDVDSVVSAGYKFAADHPAISTVLTGTSNPVHLQANAAALKSTKLPMADKKRLIELFSKISEYA